MVLQRKIVVLLTDPSQADLRGFEVLVSQDDLGRNF
jgi:hypothetical protein